VGFADRAGADVVEAAVGGLDAVPVTGSAIAVGEADANGWRDM